MGAAGGTESAWVNTQQAARRLGVTTRTLYRFIDEGDLPAYRMGRVIRLKTTDVDEFVERCRIAPGSLGTAPGRSGDPGSDGHGVAEGAYSSAGDGSGYPSDGLDAG